MVTECDLDFITATQDDALWLIFDDEDDDDDNSYWEADVDIPEAAAYDKDRYRSDVFEVLDKSPNEVLGLLVAIRDGMIDGEIYSGSCACLIGTLARLRGCGIGEMPGICPDPTSPAERFFSWIRKGHTPDNSAFSALAERWVMEWIEARAEKGGDPWPT